MKMVGPNLKSFCKGLVESGDYEVVFLITWVYKYGNTQDNIFLFAII